MAENNGDSCREDQVEPVVAKPEINHKEEEEVTLTLLTPVALSPSAANDTAIGKSDGPPNTVSAMTTSHLSIQSDTPVNAALSVPSNISTVTTESSAASNANTVPALTPRKSQSKAPCWQYFERVSDEDAKCKVCGKVIKCRASITRGLNKHLIGVHKLQLWENTNQKVGESEAKNDEHSVKKTKLETEKPLECSPSLPEIPSVANVTYVHKLKLWENNNKKVSETKDTGENYSVKKAKLETERSLEHSPSLPETPRASNITVNPQPTHQFHSNRVQVETNQSHQSGNLSDIVRQINQLRRDTDQHNRILWQIRQVLLEMPFPVNSNRWTNQFN